MVSVSVSKKIGIEKSIGIGFEKILVSEKVSVLVSKKFGIEKSIGIGIGKILVSKKVSVLVSKKIGIGKKYRYRYRKKLVSEKSIGIGIVQILGFVTHCPFACLEPKLDRLVLICRNLSSPLCS